MQFVNGALIREEKRIARPASKVTAREVERETKETVSAGKLKVQAYFVAVFLLNVIYNALPFFALKKFFLARLGITVGRQSYIHTPVKFFSLRNLSIGDNSTVNPQCYLDARSGIRIGNNVNIAHNTKIYTLGHNINAPDLPLVGRPVEIGDDVFIFSNVIILPGVTVGKGSVIFPGSVVVKDVPAYSVVGGNPAKFIKERNRIQYAKTNYGYWFAP